MNAKLHFTMFFNSINCAIRDTFEYFLSGREFDVKAYENKKILIKKALSPDSPFDRFVKSNGEMGKKVFDQLQSLYDLTYGDNSRFVRIDNGKIVVDSSLKIKAMDCCVPLHFSFVNIALTHYNHLEENEKDERFLELIELESKFFCFVSNFVLSRVIFTEKFKEFNASMRQHNGQENVESNFIISEMQKFISAHKWIVENEGKKFEEISNKQEEIFKRGLDIISGKIQPKEGSNIDQELEQVIKELDEESLRKHAICSDLFSKIVRLEQVIKELDVIMNPVEVEYKQKHEKCMQILRDFEMDLRKELDKTKN